MDENIVNIEIKNIKEYRKILIDRINNIIKNATYSELSKYVDMLPRYESPENTLFSWGVCFLNEYYKIINKLDNIYILYLKENFYNIEFTYEEFLTFSRLLNTTFTDYNPNRIRKRDKEPYQSGDDVIDYIVNSISSVTLHSPRPHAYEITNFKLGILLDTLNKRKRQLLDEEFKRIDLEDNLLNDVLSKQRIKELKEKL